MVGPLDRKGRGVVAAGPEGKPREARVHGALPGESIVLERYDRLGPADIARTVEVVEPSPDRVDARCPHYGMCGGCSLMHLAPDAQVAHKQDQLLADFAAHDLTPATILAPLRAEPWTYRRRARLGAKWVPAKDKVLVGFREKDRRFVANLDGCEILSGSGGRLIPALSQLIEGLSIRSKLPQIELSVADDTPGAATALVFRVLEPPTAEDRQALATFAAREGVRVFLQPGGLDTVAPLDSETPTLLEYALPTHDLRLEFRPTDFVQVNAAINRAMIDLALELLDVRPEHRVLDLFCGLGNFSLPLARRAREVVGIEGDAALVERARANAAINEIGNATFLCRDLYSQASPKAEPPALDWLGGPYDRALLDPPRSGAAQIVAGFEAIAAPRVVYVACSPESLARDAATLVGRHGYRLEAAGVLDMFPHTAHVESIALFERD